MGAGEPLRSGAELVRVGGYGPAHWLAHDAFGALSHQDTDAALAHIEANEQLANGYGDRLTGLRCREILVNALSAAGRFDESLAIGADLMVHYQDVGRDASRLQVLGQMIMTRLASGDCERALEHITDGLVGLSRLRDSSTAACAAFSTVANAASLAEMFELSASQLRQGRQLAHLLDQPFLARMVDGMSARNETRWAARLEMIGRTDEATARYREALRAAIRAQAGEPSGQWLRVGKICEGYAWASLGEPELGRSTLLDVLGRYGAPMGAEDSLILRLGLARACAALGLVAEAREHLTHTAGVRDVTFSHQWQTAIVLESAEIERVEHGDHPAIGLARHAAMLLATALWEERERRLEAVMVRMQMLELAEENRRVGHAATEDALTGLGNRRQLDTALLELSDAAPSSSCLLFIDLDKFKAINDLFSHAVGDAVLRGVADILRHESRETDVVARYGGDEFVIMLRGTPLLAAVRVGERIRAAVAANPWGRIAPGLHARVSVGIAEHRLGMTHDELMSAADAALYQAKQLGRDRIAVA